jgi:hypothetical protein
MLHGRSDAYLLLKDLGAPERLIVHLQLVGEAADLLMQAYKDPAGASPRLARSRAV